MKGTEAETPASLLASSFADHRRGAGPLVADLRQVGDVEPRAQPMCRPPFTEKSAPVAKPDSSEASHDTIDAMSSGVPRRFTGMPETILSSTSWRIFFTISVAM